jgi:hypothetical protein
MLSVLGVRFMADEKRDQAVQPLDYPGRFIPPVAYNSFYVIVQEKSTRFTLGEQMYADIPAHYSATFMLPTETSVDLAKTILRLAVRQNFLTLDDLKKEVSDLAREMGFLG